MISIGIALPDVRTGPFLIKRHAMRDGWVRYALVIEGDEIKAWSSMPGREDCIDVVRKTGAISEAKLETLLRTNPSNTHTSNTQVRMISLRPSSRRNRGHAG